MIIDGELHTVTQTLSLNHLGQAFDSLLSARDACDIKPTNRANILATRYSISSVIHGFAALESEVSTLGYEMFSNPGSQLFLPPEGRPFLVQRLAQSWNGAPVLNKLFFLSSKDGVVILPEQLQQRLRE